MLDKNTKYFINVAAYAKENNITLKQAHEEIQPWLFGQEYIFWELYKDAVMFTYADYLEINYEHSGIITWAYEDCINDNGKEIVLERLVKTEIKLTPTIIEEELVEFNGKQYSKAKLEKALKLIEESK